MSLPLIGTTPQAQAANIVIPATSGSSGAITFIGPSGVQGSIITCTVVIPNAPPGATFTATLGTINAQGVIQDTWGGESTAGRFQILVGQTLVVTGTGLLANTAYNCTFSTVTDVGAVQLVVPEPNSSAVIAQTFNQAGVDVLPNIITGSSVAGANWQVTAIRSYQTIVIATSLITPAYFLVATVSNLTQGNLAGVSMSRGNSGGTSHIYIAVPIICQAGDILQIHLSGSGTQAFTATIYGITTSVSILSGQGGGTGLVPAETPVRSDGRPYPTGALPIQSTTAGGSTVVAAPAVGQSILLKHLVIAVLASGASGTIAHFAATINGTAVWPLSCAANTSGGNTAVVDFGEGLLLDGNTALTTAEAVAAPGAVAYSGSYDIVN